MFEKRFPAVPPHAFTADGTADGLITVADTRPFKVKQEVYLTASTLQPLDNIEVKRVLSITQLLVGPKGGSIAARSNVSAYTVALGATISANEQDRPNIGMDYHERANFEEEPTVADRVILVDEMGDKYNAENPFPVEIEGSITIGSVSIVDSDGDELDVNPDGSIDVNISNQPIDVNIVSSSAATPGLNVAHNEISAVAAGIETTVLTFIASGLGFRLHTIYVAGENIALFRVKVNSVTILTKRTFFGNLNEEFAFESFDNGLKLATGDIVTVTVLHNRPMLADFESTILGLNL